MSESFFLKNRQFSIGTSILFYVVYVDLVAEVIWPIVFVAIVKVLAAFISLPAAFIYFLMAIVKLIIWLWGAIVLQASCINPNGLKWRKARIISEKEMRLIGNKKRWLIITMIYIIICVAFLFSPLYHPFTPEQEYLYTQFYDKIRSESYLAFTGLSRLFICSVRGVFTAVVFYIFIFLIAFDVIIPRGVIIGIQKYIWKLDY